MSQSPSPAAKQEETVTRSLTGKFVKCECLMLVRCGWNGQGIPGTRFDMTDGTPSAGRGAAAGQRRRRAVVGLHEVAMPFGRPLVDGLQLAPQTRDERSDALVRIVVVLRRMLLDRRWMLLDQLLMFHQVVAAIFAARLSPVGRLGPFHPNRIRRWRQRRHFRAAKNL